MAINGNNIFIAIGTDTTPIAGTRSDDIQVSGETIEIASPTQGSWREFLTGRKEWSVTVGFLVLANTDVAQLLNVNNSYTLKLRTTSTAYLTGSAIMTQCVIRASRGDIVQGSFTFKGNGALSAVS